jgi:D-amino-acid oxidase
MKATRLDNPNSTSWSRRDWLKLAGASVATSAISGCAIDAGSRTSADYRRPHSMRPFSRPLIAEELIVRTSVGLRPFRPSGFVVRSERIGEKMVIHNYGHGGAGITFSWGTAELAVRELPDIVDRRAAVLGCGVMGLSTARLLQQRGWKVTIYAKDLPPNTTSDVSGGHWAPTGVFARGEGGAGFLSQFDEALRISHAMFLKLLGPEYGVIWRENYHLSYFREFARDNSSIARAPDLFPETAQLQPEEHPFSLPYAWRHLSLLIEPAIYLPRLMRDVRDAQGEILARHIRDLTELASLEEPVIFNCTGLGARELFGDTELVPVRGQLVFMAADERIDYNTHAPGSLYMFPRSDGILLGGTFERGASHLEPDADTTARIVRGHANVAATMRI